MLNKAGEDAKPARHAGSRQDGMPSCGSTHTTDAALLLRPARWHTARSSPTTIATTASRRQKDATTSAPLQAPRSARERAAADNKLGAGAEAGAGPGPQQKKSKNDDDKNGGTKNARAEKRREQQEDSDYCCGGASSSCWARAQARGAADDLA